MIANKKDTESMRSHFQSLAANKVFVDYVYVIDMSMISSWFLSCNIMYKDIMLGVGRVGGKDEYCPVTYVMIIVDFLLTPEMQMLPKYHQLSCFNMKKKEYVFVLYNKRMIY